MKGTLTNITKQLLSEGKKLRVFDFDDTLVQTDAKIYVINNGKKKTLTPAEYATYKPKTGDEFDFKEFSGLKNPQIIKTQFNVLKRIFNATGERKIVILTARGDYKPIYDFLSDHGVPIRVIALRDGDPKKKAQWIEKQIKDGYDDIYFADDSSKNIKAVDKLKQKYPSIKMRTRLVKLQK